MCVLCVCMCVCVCERASEREREGRRGREGGRRWEREGGARTPDKREHKSLQKNRSVVIGQMSAHRKPDGAAGSLAVVFT